VRTDRQPALSNSYGDYTGMTAAPIQMFSTAELWHVRVGSTVYYFRENNTALDYSTDNGATWVNIGPLPHAVPVTAWNSRQIICVHNLNTSNMMYCQGANLQRSSDGGTTWGNAPTNVANSSCAVPAMVAQYPEGEAFIVGCDSPAAGNWIYLTYDFGTSWLNKSGNLENYLTSGADTIYMIIPVQEDLVT